MGWLLWVGRLVGWVVVVVVAAWGCEVSAKHAPLVRAGLMVRAKHAPLVRARYPGTRRTPWPAHRPAEKMHAQIVKVSCTRSRRDVSSTEDRQT
eukprot:3924075-Prymnesium_polylepis.1